MTANMQSNRDAWNGQFIAKWPDTQESRFDLNGNWIWEGDVLVEGYVLRRWDKTTGPIMTASTWSWDISRSPTTSAGT